MGSYVRKYSFIQCNLMQLLLASSCDIDLLVYYAKSRHSLPKTICYAQDDMMYTKDVF